MTERTPLASLAPDAHAVLSLVLELGSGWDEISELLGIDREAVRARARAAADGLVGGALESPPGDDRGRLVDYILGQQAVSERARTRKLLETSATARAWAEALSSALAPMLPGPPPVAPTPPAEPLPATLPPEPAEPPSATPPAEPAQPPEQAPPAERAQPAPEQGRPARAPGNRRLQAAGAVLLATGCVIAALVLIGTSGGATTPARIPAHKRSRASSSVRTVGRLVLSAAASGSRALGAGAIVQQRGSQLLLLQARGVAPNHKGNSYAVWLFNTEVDSRLLGFVSPPVGADGTFSSGTTLPDDAVRFHEVLVTRETSTDPKQPGKVVLRSVLSLG